MSVASRIQEIETHIGDIYDTLEVGGTDLTGLNKNIVNINSSLKDRYKYFLNNGVEVIWNNWEKVIGEGTEFTLENTIQAPMKIDLKGNTYQKSTTGKNLLDVPSSYSFEGNKSKNITLPAGSYYINCGNITKGGENDPFIVIPNIGGIALTQNLNRSFTLSSEITSVSFYSNGWDWNASKGITSTVENLMISTSGGEYEPYTGGNPAPNPDYPQDIQVVSGDNNIEVVGKNLAPTDWATDFISRINDNTKAKLQTEDNRNCLFYTASAGNQEHDTKYMFKTNWKENTQYTFSFYMKSTANAGNIAIAYTDGTTQIFNNLVTANTWSKAVMTSNANKTIKYLKTYWTSGSSYIDLNTFMVEEGEQATSYQPYQSQSYPINLGNTELCKIGEYQDYIIRSSGKNLFDKGNALHYTTDGSGNTTTSTQLNSTDYIPCNSGDSFTISGIPTTTSDYNFKVVFFDSNKNYISRPIAQIGTINVKGNYSTTAPTNAKYVMAQFYNTMEEEQLEKGTTATTYEPYGKGKWYIHKETGKVVYDGTEIWNRFQVGSSIIQYYRDLNTKHDANIPLAKSNYFRSGVLSNRGVGYENSVYTYSGGIAFNPNSFPTTEDWKAWLGTHNTEVYYVLATPTTTEITDTTLLSQLETAKKSYDTQTNISQDNDDLPFILDVTALKNI